MYEILTDEQKAKIGKRIEEKIMKAVDKIDFQTAIEDSVFNSIDFGEIAYDYLDTEKIGNLINAKAQEAFKKVMK